MPYIYIYITLIDLYLLDLTCSYIKVLVIFEISQRRKFTQCEMEGCLLGKTVGSIFSRGPPGWAFL